MSATSAGIPRRPIQRFACWIAYLPQFHPILENDVWWGTGFTDWTNVTRAIPRLPAIQPRLLGELGFTTCATPPFFVVRPCSPGRYGIGGFCFHHYWFGGRDVCLRGHLDLLLANQGIDLPFCINWANENWTCRWDGLDHEILIAQSHSAEDDEAFARSVVPSYAIAATFTSTAGRY